MKKIQEHLGLVFLIIIAIFAVAIGGYFTLRKGVFIGDDFYYKVRADKFVHNTVNYVERTKDDTFLLVADGKKQNVSYTMKGDQVTFSFADDTINGTWTGDQLLAADGSPVQNEKWVLCPVCGNKTRIKIRENTVLLNFPLFCPKCRQEQLINVQQLKVTIIKEPDAQTQSR